NPFDQAAQSGAHAFALGILDTPAQHAYTVKPAAIALGMPSQVIIGAMPGQQSRRLQTLTQPRLQLLPKSFYAPCFDDVLQSRQFPVTAISEVAMNRDDRLCRRQQLIWTHKGDRIREPRMAGADAVTLPQASAREQSETGDSASVAVRYETEIIRVDIG